jgi:hypothetical protein
MKTELVFLNPSIITSIKVYKEEKEQVWVSKPVPEKKNMLGKVIQEATPKFYNKDCCRFRTPEDLIDRFKDYSNSHSELRYEKETDSFFRKSCVIVSTRSFGETETIKKFFDTLEDAMEAAISIAKRAKLELLFSNS